MNTQKNRHQQVREKLGGERAFRGNSFFSLLLVWIFGARGAKHFARLHSKFQKTLGSSFANFVLSLASNIMYVHSLSYSESWWCFRNRVVFIHSKTTRKTVKNMNTHLQIRFPLLLGLRNGTCKEYRITIPLNNTGSPIQALHFIPSYNSSLFLFSQAR